MKTGKILFLSPNSTEDVILSNRTPQKAFRKNLFALEEELKNENNETKGNLEKKLLKYKKKYSEKQEKFYQEQARTEELLKLLRENNEKILNLKIEITEKREKIKIMSELITQNKNELARVIKELEESEGKNPRIEQNEEILDFQHSLTSLQLENLQEKLNAKNKRVEELEIELFKESATTEMLMKDLNSLKLQLYK